MDVELAVASDAELGECPLWSPDTGTLYWLDLVGCVLHGHIPSTGRSWTRLVDASVSSLGGLARSAHKGRVLIAHERGIVEFDLISGRQRLITHPLKGIPGVGYNDMKVDPRGRLWVSTAALDETAMLGELLRVDRHGSMPAVKGIAVANGPAFSPDGGTLYLSDSTRRLILSFSVSDSGRLADRRVFADLDAAGMPDGLTVDVEGGVWVALWEGAAVRRYAANGTLDAVVAVPAPNVTSVMFGGPNGDQLYITTARYGMDPDALVRYPGAGGLFVANPGVTARPEPAFIESAG